MPPGQEPEDNDNQDPEDDQKDPKPTTDQWDDGGDFDAERAKRTIARLRDIEKQAKDLARSNKELQTQLDTHDREKLSETEQLRLQVQDLTTERTGLQAQLEEVRIGGEIRRVARELGFADEEDAVLLIDKSRIAVDDDGKPRNINELLRGLLKSKPHLKASAGTSGPPPTPSRQDAPESGEVYDQTRRSLRTTGVYSRL